LQFELVACLFFTVVCKDCCYLRLFWFWNDVFFVRGVRVAAVV